MCHGQSIELRLLVSAFLPIRHLGQCSAHYCSFYKPYFMEFLSREISFLYVVVKSSDADATAIVIWASAKNSPLLASSEHKFALLNLIHFIRGQF